ncbi:MAG: OsmC family protein [Alphaproteobacteria bacterium]|nr:OsmC family protein [Alphaproteobacteria bacterium]
MATDSPTTATVIENGESPFAVDITVSDHRIKGDEPEGMGGKNLGPAPYDLLSAALAECTAMTVRWYARQQEWPLDKVEVVLTHQKEAKEGQRGKTDVFTKRITIHGDGLTDEQRAKLIEVAAKCPVQRTLEGTPVIKTEA